MKLAGPLFALAVALGVATSARAQNSSPRPDDRLVFIANGSTLTGASGGGGGAVTWLHPFSANALFGIGAEYQTIANAHWTLGDLTGSVTLGTPSGSHTSFSAEIHEGSGVVGAKNFDYSIVALGASHTLGNGLTFQLEDRQIDVSPSHGNLPKIGLAYAWTPKILTTVSYAHSSGGNLGTDISSVRVDFFGKGGNLLAGAAFGHASAAVVNLQTGLEQPHLLLREEFLGVSKPLARVNVQLVGDYLKLADTKRVTLNLIFTLPLQ